MIIGSILENINFEKRISINPEISPSPKRINEIRSKIKSDSVQCIFKEPQFPSKIVQTIIKDTNAKEGLLDPLGSNLKPGKDLYLNLVDNLSKNLKKCLSWFSKLKNLKEGNNTRISKYIHRS